MPKFLLKCVKRFVIVEFPSDRKLRLLPDTNFMAELRFSGEHALDGGRELPRAAISGLWDTARARLYRGGTGILLVMFTESGASAFLRKPLDALFNTTTAIEHVLEGAPELDALDERLAAAKDHVRRIQIAESFLLARVQKNGPDSFVSAAVARLEASRASIRIEELARQVGVSQSALERRFRRDVGTSPKQFASILRLKNAVRLRARGHDFISIAHSVGYSDQSHFINDFKRATGLAPSAFFRQSVSCKSAEFLQVTFAAN
jgi:AraC-like DNA-binding protein